MPERPRWTSDGDWDWEEEALRYQFLGYSFGICRGAPRLDTNLLWSRPRPIECGTRRPNASGCEKWGFDCSVIIPSARSRATHLCWCVLQVRSMTRRPGYAPPRCCCNYRLECHGAEAVGARRSTMSLLVRLRLCRPNVVFRQPSQGTRAASRPRSVLRPATTALGASAVFWGGATRRLTIFRR